MKELTRVLALTLMLGMVLCGVGLALRDIDLPDDSRLTPPPFLPLDNRNSFTWFQRAAEHMGPLEKAMASGDVDAMEAAFVKHQKFFTHMERGLRCEVHSVPPIEGIQTNLNYLAAWRKMARVMRMGSLLLLGQGKTEAAFDQALRILRFGEIIGKSGGTLRHTAVVMDVNDLGLRWLMQIAQTKKLSPAKLKSCARSLRTFGDTSSHFEHAIKREYILASNAVDLYAESMAARLAPRALRRLPAWCRYQPNRTRKLIRETYVRALKNAGRYYAKRVPLEPAISSGTSGIRNRLRLLARGNVVGRFAHDMLLRKELRRADLDRCWEAAKFRAAAYVLAIKAHEAERGRRRIPLKDLMPDLLRSWRVLVPIDPFDGERMRYDAATGRVWSVGSDLIDNHGSRRPYGADHEEPTFHMSAPSRR